MAHAVGVGVHPRDQAPKTLVVQADAFARAVKAAETLVASMSERDNAAVVLTSEARQPTREELTFDRRALQQRLRQRSPGFGGHGVHDALLAGCDLLAQSKLPRKRVVLCHDMTRAAWSLDALRELRARLDKREATLTILSVRPAGSLPNAAVLGVKVSRRTGDRRSLTLAATVAPPAERTAVKVAFGREVAVQGFVAPSRARTA